ncbi:hypothetical protein [Aquirhabdus parva]|uniref:Cobalt-zinc-cadmium resistance protein n=1 Tax=Aquirhabdus parva TaxID=2283318 RepID=A0A345P4Q1_9GAMM|nr:hypothetical protein [Aquirhabdus parva]AXI02260.1 hypothetical protein HYN46_05035 [Aquirhabdus parva]
MRTIFIFLLLTWLPIQGSWSVAAQFCQHESQPTTWHWGHHQHLKHGAGLSENFIGQDKASIDKKVNINHGDHIGHLDHGLELVTDIAPITIMQCFACIPQSLPPPDYESAILDLPETPRWSPAAIGGVALI